MHELISLYVGTMLILCALLCRWAARRIPGPPESPHQAVCLPPGQRQWAVWTDGWLSLVCVNCHHSLNQSINCHHSLNHCQSTVTHSPNHCQSTVTIHPLTVNQLSLFAQSLSINCHYSLNHCQSTVTIHSITVTTSSFTVNQLSPLLHLLSINFRHFIFYCQSTMQLLFYKHTEHLLINNYVVKSEKILRKFYFN